MWYAWPRERVVAHRPWTFWEPAYSGSRTLTVLMLPPGHSAGFRFSRPLPKLYSVTSLYSALPSSYGTWIWASLALLRTLIGLDSPGGW